MTPGTVLTAEAAKIAAGCGIRVRPWFGAGIDQQAGAGSYLVTSAPASSLARFFAYRIAVIALWPPADDESPASHSARKAEAMAGEISAGADAMLAAVERGEL